jgi:hypothetical protein
MVSRFMFCDFAFYNSLYPGVKKNRSHEQFKATNMGGWLKHPLEKREGVTVRFQLTDCEVPLGLEVPWAQPTAESGSVNPNWVL